MCAAALSIATISWAVVGYSLAFDGTGDLVDGLGISDGFFYGNAISW